VVADPVPLRRRRRWWLYLLLFAVLVVAWLAFSAVSLLRARHDANLGMDLVRRARSSLTPTDIVRGQGADLLRGAKGDFARAHHRVASPWIAPLRVVPVVGRQVHSIDALTGSAARVVAVGSDAMTRSRRELDAAVASGGARVNQVHTLGAIADDSSRKLQHVDLGPRNALIGPLRDARDKFAGDLDKIRRAIADVGYASAGLDQLLKGPSRYLLVAANNGEMRNGSGMWLSAGLLDFQDGRFTIHDMRPTADLALQPPGVPVTGDLAARWGWSVPNQEWRNLMLSPLLPENAQLAAQMWQAQGGPAIDGILVIDPVGLQALLSASGPVNVDGREIDANNVVQYVLHDQYVGVPFGNSQQQQRREQLSGIARAALTAIDQHGWHATSLVDQLRLAAQGRHVLAWSNKPVQERAWQAAGIDGQLNPDSLLVSVLNRGGNKVDQYLNVDATFDTTPSSAGTDVRLQLKLSNSAPVNDPPYVIGPFPGSGLRPGDYLGILAVTVPGSAGSVRIDNGAPLVAAGADGPTRVVATYVALQRGQSRTLTVQFTLPTGVREVAVEPSARVPGERWRAGSDQWVDAGAHVLGW
jgi:hypothetical protein